MPAIKELQDVVDLLGQYDEFYQRMAIKDLIMHVEHAEQDIAVRHLTRLERRAVREPRGLAEYERRYGKTFADEIRAQLAAIKRGDLYE